MTTTSSEHLSDAYLTPDQLVERWHGTIFSVVPLTLTRWRKQGKGPSFIKVGPHIYYRRAAVTTYENSILQTNLTTSDS
jgi:hypothetical protein